MNRQTRQRIAEETIQIIQRRRYQLPSGRTVSIRESIEQCFEQSHLILPTDERRLSERVLTEEGFPTDCRVECENETTLEGIAYLLQQSPESRVGALNFASAKNPGGGFLGGSQAQEESLARSSALYGSLTLFPNFYDSHRQQRSCLYTSAMIVSPDCPIIRDDDGQLLEQPRLATFITCAAPNAGAIAQNEPSELHMIEGVLRERAEKVLTVAAAEKCPRLVLGAWGCGVFQNEPEMVAQIFADLLARGSLWANRFEVVRFSVLDRSADQATFRAFAQAFKNR